MTQVDNLVVLTQGTADQGVSDDFLRRYRTLVNADLLYVNVDLSGRAARCVQIVILDSFDFLSQIIYFSSAVWFFIAFIFRLQS